MQKSLNLSRTKHLLCRIVPHSPSKHQAERRNRKVIKVADEIDWTLQKCLWCIIPSALSLFTSTSVSHLLFKSKHHWCKMLLHVHNSDYEYSQDYYYILSLTLLLAWLPFDTNTLQVSWQILGWNVFTITQSPRVYMYVTLSNSWFAEE